jgi:predicted helicase
MLIIQHILTGHIFRKIFDVADFIRRNVIAQEIEKSFPPLCPDRSAATISTKAWTRS